MNIHRKLIERIVLTGPQAEVDMAFAYCGKHGFWVTHSGPMPKDRTRLDVTRFRIIAERETNKEINHDM